ncbi:MAG TPA: cellulose synthase operon protein YhjQ/BcsQ [Terriglobales bacterium]|jgi:pilus assembly protein CpaE|nr:cellulose synthase operon protein YhjQ/BcsQ [Terriglobales bacterium]
MPELSVVIVASDSEQRAVLQVLVDGTSVARTAHTCASFPVAATDPVTRRIQAANADVVLVDIPADNASHALHAIELLHQELPDSALFAVGSLSQPQIIVNAMRAGAREFVERPTTTTDLLEAFVRLTTAQRKSRRDEMRGKMFTVVNAKGGSGGTTVAVNLALALQSAHGSTALVDIAPLGHCALHLNLKPLFSVGDAIRNLHRLDSSLLESFMTRHAGGLQLLAGPTTPVPAEPSNAEFAKLFDMLIGHFRYIVVDDSSRIDATTRLVSNLANIVLLVAHTDVASLWSAARVQQYLSESGSRDKVQLILNRFRKIPGFSESDAEAAAGIKLLWKIPNQYFAVSTAIDRGVPLSQHNNTEIARSFAGLAARLTEDDLDVKRKAWSLFKTV